MRLLLSITVGMLVPVSVWGMTSESYTIESPRFLPHSTDALKSESYEITFSQTQGSVLDTKRQGSARSTLSPSPNTLIGAQIVTPVMGEQGERVTIDTPSIPVTSEVSVVEYGDLITLTNHRAGILSQDGAHASVGRDIRLSILLGVLLFLFLLKRKTRWGERYLPF